MISTLEKESLLAAFARAEMEQNPGAKWSRYKEALESVNDLSERAETDLERHWISNVRLANCRCLVKLLTSVDAHIASPDGSDVGVLVQFRPELREMIKEDAAVRDQIERFYEKHPFFPRNWATVITNSIVQDDGNPTRS